MKRHVLTTARTPPSEMKSICLESSPLKFSGTGSSSEGPDVIDVAYRVQGLRLGESPQPKNLIGGSMQGKN